MNQIIVRLNSKMIRGLFNHLNIMKKFLQFAKFGNGGAFKTEVSSNGDPEQLEIQICESNVICHTFVPFLGRGYIRKNDMTHDFVTSRVGQQHEIQI